MGASPWTKFRNLCGYYSDCVKYSEKRQEYLFTDQQDETFIVPALEAGWHLKSRFDIETSTAQRFARNVLLTADDTDELFLGYPLSSFISPKGFHCLCPVMLFPVSVTTLGPGRTSGLRVEVDRQGIDINRDWVEFHIPRDRQNYFIRACERSDDEMRSVDVESALQFISRHLRRNIDPNFMDFTLRHDDAVRGILNTAVLFVGGKTKYTRNLVRELGQIRNESDAVLDSTALAYVFRDPPLPVTVCRDENRRMPAVFTGNPLNEHQYMAVAEALNSPVSKVTGPPGTGKSHMSVNLIANEVLNGGSVLFTSKNHKAIHAVFEMCQTAKLDPDFDLVEFCTAPGNDSAAQWDKMKDRLEQVVDLVRARAAGKGLGELGELPDAVRCPALCSLEEGLGKFRDAEGTLERYAELRRRVSRFEQLIVRIDELLSRIPAVSRDDPAFRALLENCVDALEEEPRLSRWGRFLERVKRILRLADDRPDVRSQLNALVPGIAPAYSSRRSVSRSVRRLLDTLKFRSVVEGWRLGEFDAVRSEASSLSYEKLKESLKAELVRVNASAREAYVEAFRDRVSSVDTLDLVSRISGALKENPAQPLSFMSAIGDDGRYRKPLALFRDFHRLFPAWAVTLLSLRRASPCLPGVFSLVLIDEASQCEIPPMIPALFRARRVAVVGDPDQFPPVITIKTARDVSLRRKWNILNAEMDKFGYSDNNVFSVVPRSKSQTVRLVEHFRCMDDIAMYINDEFYNGELCPCVGDRADQGYEAYGLKPGMAWIDAPGGDEAEAQAALGYLKALADRGFKGTVGVISPLRKIADRMKTLCFERRSEMPEGLVDERINTANGFQGGQCDVVVFLLGLNGNRVPGHDEWYVTADENKYIYNVSVSRAKVCFTTFGDKSRALASGIGRIVKLIPEERRPAAVKVGPGEEVLRAALCRAGLEPVAQYPVFGRYLDLALVDSKIDIEVDGQAWHLDRNGCRKADDIHRDLLLETNGWRVVRFWHHEVMEDVASCVARIEAILGG